MDNAEDENYVRGERHKTGIQGIFTELETGRAGMTSAISELQRTLQSCLQTIHTLREESSNVKDEFINSQKELEERVEKLASSIQDHSCFMKQSTPYGANKSTQRPELPHIEETLIQTSKENAAANVLQDTSTDVVNITSGNAQAKDLIKVEHGIDYPIRKDSTPYLIDWNLVSENEDMLQIKDDKLAVVLNQSDSEGEI